MNDNGKGRFRSTDARGRTRAVYSCVPSIITGIRAQQLRQHGQKTYAARLTGCELTLLGRLLFHWPTIVGHALAQHTRPRRFFRGQLLIACRDSGWLHTLTYVKPNIKNRLLELFPEASITGILGRIESLLEIPERPQPVVWPAWQEYPDMPLPDIADPRLIERVQTCRKKILARREGLKNDGWRPCVRCGTAWVKSSGAICAVCRSSEQMARLRRGRTILDGVPWMTTTQLMEELPGLSEVEAEAVRQDLIEEMRRQIAGLVEEIPEHAGLLRDFLRLRKELLHLFFLHSCRPPDQIRDKEWLKSPVLEPAWVDRLMAIRNTVYAHPHR